MCIDRYKEKGILFPEIVFTQSLLESNFYQSAIYKENNNPHGMKINKRGFAKGVNRGHALYDTVDDAILDYKAWQTAMIKSHLRSYKNNFKTKEDYYFFLNHLYKDKKGKVYSYAEDENYVKKLNEILQQNIEKQKQNGDSWLVETVSVKQKGP